jgi:hypothetical protein
MTSIPQESSRRPEAADPKIWWLAIRGGTEGPYTAGFIIASLRSGTIARDTQACLEGTQHWRPLAQWAEFDERSEPNTRPPLPPPGEIVDDRMVTNPNLPRMANWICIYCIVARPILSVNWLITSAIGHYTLGPVEFLLSISMTVVLLIGGIRLRNRRKNAPTIIKIGMWLSIASVVFALQVCVRAGSFPTLLYLCELAFQVIAVIWLHRHGRSLAETA